MLGIILDTPLFCDHASVVGGEAEPELFVVCPERERLLTELRDAITLIVELTNSELEAAIADDPGRFESIKLQMEEARRRKNMCEAAYERHLACCHGCVHV